MLTKMEGLRGSDRVGYSTEKGSFIWAGPSGSWFSISFTLDGGLDDPLSFRAGIMLGRDDAHVILSLKRKIEDQLEEWFPGCVLPIPDNEVDPDVMREWSQMQERI